MVAIGLIGGAYRWGASGIGAEARRAIARLSAVLGDVATVERMMTGIEEPVFAWQDVVSTEIRAEDLNPIFDLAARALEPSELARRRAALASSVIRTGIEGDRRPWAEATMRGVAATELPDGEGAVWARSAVASSAMAMGERRFEADALRRFARSGLDAGDHRNMVTAALRLRAFEAALR